jgi:hypothetical protein
MKGLKIGERKDDRGMMNWKGCGRKMSPNLR